MSQTKVKDLAQALASSSQKGISLTIQEEKLTRQYYLEIIDDLNLTYLDKCQKLTTELGAELARELNYVQPVKLEKISYYPNLENQIGYLSTFGLITVGRLKDNDITIDGPIISRIQALIYIFKEAIVIIDSWSMNGTSCYDLSTGQEFSSIQNQRVVMNFSRDNAIMIKIDQIEVILNPAICCLCFDGPRQVRFTCKHAVVCRKCYTVMQNNAPTWGSETKVKCPICQRKIETIDFGHFARTYAVTPRPLKKRKLILNSSDSSVKSLSPNVINLFSISPGDQSSPAVNKQSPNVHKESPNNSNSLSPVKCRPSLSARNCLTKTSVIYLSSSTWSDELFFNLSDKSD